MRVFLCMIAEQKDHVKDVKRLFVSTSQVASYGGYSVMVRTGPCGGLREGSNPSSHPNRIRTRKGSNFVLQNILQGIECLHGNT